MAAAEISNGNFSESCSITKTLKPLGTAPLDEDTIAHYVLPLFSCILKRDVKETYLANHSLGRPLDATINDLAEGMNAWYTHLDEAWDPWWKEMDAWRAATANLLNASRADCIVPKTSAGQGLRSVLNSFGTPPRVLTTTGEFDSLDHILKQYATTNHATVTWVAAREDGCFYVNDLIDKLNDVDLVVVSHVFFATGQILADLPQLISATHQVNAYILLDVYHSYGVLPLDVTALDIDFAVAGSYKYLRGGPGACWLYVSPKILMTERTTRDTGWFAKKDPFSYHRAIPPILADGGNRWLESTFNPLSFYQARAGLTFVTTIGVSRLRAWSLKQKRFIAEALRRNGVFCRGEGEEYGAFLIVSHKNSSDFVTRLKTAGVNVDARNEGVRLTPDILNTETQLTRAVEIIAELF
ncbi:unnamed protein product [Adineta ricciae]|uniref:Aminotransferase class V domain-containing protein n=1 Tax=Adineta ricciae TaxID=249248 RepID=A0A815KU66_ADIRI|nr:unnamed protein product [Adineta ricciae]CAF1400333.1 unnamed protein product [Adineta ricciae]